MTIDYTKPSSFLLYIWQAPQAIVGALIAAFIRKHHKYENCGLIVHRIPLNASFCFSLGPFIFTPDNVIERVLKHESGHSKQSLFLGPLYLPVVGASSLALFWYRRIKHKDEDWYCKHFPENWANKLGGVK